MAQIDWWIYQVVGKVFLAALARWSTLLKVTVSKQIRFVGLVMRKNQLEATALTGKIEGKRARGRQRKPPVHGLDIYCMWRLMERQQRNVNNVISICWSPTSESETDREKYVDVCMFRHNTTTWQTDRQTDRQSISVCRRAISVPTLNMPLRSQNCFLLRVISVFD